VHRCEKKRFLRLKNIFKIKNALFDVLFIFQTFLLIKTLANNIIPEQYAAERNVFFKV